MVLSTYMLTGLFVIPAPGDLVCSSGFLRYLTDIWCIYIHAGTHTYNTLKISVSFKREKKENLCNDIGVTIKILDFFLYRYLKDINSSFGK